MSRNPPPMVVLVASILLAGCLSSSSNETDAGDPNADTATVRGIVVSDELFPVTDALVTLGPLDPTTTDLGGQFVFAEVPLGDHQLTINASGYESYTERLFVQASIDTLSVSLKGIPGKAPYALSLIFVGFDACNFAAVYSAGPGWDDDLGPCPFGDRQTAFKTEVAETWAAGVFELAWETNEEMIFAASVATEDTSHGFQRAACGITAEGHDWCPAMVWGKSPQRIYARPNDTEYAAKYAIDGKEVFPGGENFTSWITSSYSGYFHEEINGTFYDVCATVNPLAGAPATWGCPFGIGYSTGVKVTYYHTMFYMQPPGGKLEDFSAMPDG